MKEAHQPLYSTRQRVVVITFATPQDAQDWDDCGRPFGIFEGQYTDLTIAEVPA